MKIFSTIFLLLDCIDAISISFQTSMKRKKLYTRLKSKALRIDNALIIHNRSVDMFADFNHEIVIPLSIYILMCVYLGIEN